MRVLEPAATSTLAEDCSSKAHGTVVIAAVSRLPEVIQPGGVADPIDRHPIAPAAARPRPPAAATRGPRTTAITEPRLRSAILGVLAALSALLLLKPSPRPTEDTTRLQAIAADIVTSVAKATGTSQVSGNYLAGTGFVFHTSAQSVPNGDVASWLSAIISPTRDQFVGVASNTTILWEVRVSTDTSGSHSFRMTPATLATPTSWRTGVAVPAPSDSAAADSAPTGATSGAPAAAAPKGIAPKGIAPKGIAPKGIAPKGIAPKGIAPKGTAPKGIAPKGIAPKGIAPKGTAPKGTGVGPSPTPRAPAVRPTAASAAAATAADRFRSDDFSKDSGLWNPMTGSWSVANGVYSQTDDSGYDYITQFATPPPATAYSVSVRMRSMSKTLGAGLILGQPKVGTREGANIIDISGGNYLHWGKFSTVGGVYRLVGGAALPAVAAKGQWHVLKVVVSAGTTRVYWDGTQLGQTAAAPAGTVGLVTSVSKVDFDGFAIGAP